MPRTIVDIPDVQLSELDAICGRLGISRAEGVRRALQRYFESQASTRHEGFGLWLEAPPAPEDAPGRSAPDDAPGGSAPAARPRP